MFKFFFAGVQSSLSPKLRVKITSSNSNFVLMIKSLSFITTRFSNFMKQLCRLNFSWKSFMLLLFTLCKMKFDGVSIKDYRVTYWDIGTLCISYILKFFLQLYYKIFLATLFMQFCLFWLFVYLNPIMHNVAKWSGTL